MYDEKYAVFNINPITQACLLKQSNNVDKNCLIFKDTFLYVSLSQMNNNNSKYRLDCNVQMFNFSLHSWCCLKRYL